MTADDSYDRLDGDAYPASHHGPGRRSARHHPGLLRGHDTPSRPPAGSCIPLLLQPTSVIAPAGVAAAELARTTAPAKAPATNSLRKFKTLLLLDPAERPAVR